MGLFLWLTPESKLWLQSELETLRRVPKRRKAIQVAVRALRFATPRRA